MATACSYHSEPFFAFDIAPRLVGSQLLNHSRGRQHLSDSSFRLQYRIAVVHRSSEIRIRERNPSEWRLAQELSRRRLAVTAKEKARLWA
jgi:hypothetical protein